MRTHTCFRALVAATLVASGAVVLMARHGRVAHMKAFGQRPITIRDLLTHTSGVGYGGGVARDRWEAAAIQGWYFADSEERIRETVRRMAALPFDAQPGERFVYGYSVDILGRSSSTSRECLSTRRFAPASSRRIDRCISGP